MELRVLVPLAAEWARTVSAQAQATGQPLDGEGLALARRVGVSAPEKIRVVVCNRMPFPDHPKLRRAAKATRLLGPGMAGLTLGYAIFVRDGELTKRLMSHELRHVAQYEAAGSIDNFLEAYLAQIVEVGYESAPYEIDARDHEIGS